MICFLFSQVFGTLECHSFNQDQMMMKNYSLEEVMFSLKIYSPFIALCLGSIGMPNGDMSSDVKLQNNVEKMLNLMMISTM